LPYKVDSTTGLIDYAKLEEKAMDFRPKLIIAGGRHVLLFSLSAFGTSLIR